MKAVLYNNDLEPITVLNLSPFCEECLQRHGRLLLPIIDPPDLAPWISGEPYRAPRAVAIRAETLMRNGKRSMMLFTDDEETSLLLTAAFLPGQTAAVNEVRQQGVARGFLEAMRVLR